MAQHIQHAKRISIEERDKRKRRGVIVAVCIAIGVIIAAAVIFLLTPLSPMNPAPIQVSATDADAPTEATREIAGNAFPETEFSDTALFDKSVGGGQQSPTELKTAKIAYLKDMPIRSTVAPADMTAVLFHQSSFSGVHPVKTKLKTADAGKAFKKHKLRINNEQEDVSGWADADTLHLYRGNTIQPMNTAIDVGAKPGTPVYAPVSGTVILVKKYNLYNEHKDFQIHIQPDNHPEFDCCILHCDKPSIKAGDRVEAGITQIAVMRDIASHLTGIQLGDYTREGGNHSHIQIGDANDAGYRRRTMQGAILTGKETSEQFAAMEKAKKKPKEEAEATQ